MAASGLGLPTAIDAGVPQPAFQVPPPDGPGSRYADAAHYYFPRTLAFQGGNLPVDEPSHAYYEINPYQSTDPANPIPRSGLSVLEVANATCGRPDTNPVSTQPLTTTIGSVTDLLNTFPAVASPYFQINATAPTSISPTSVFGTSTTIYVERPPLPQIIGALDSNGRLVFYGADGRLVYSPLDQYYPVFVTAARPAGPSGSVGAGDLPPFFSIRPEIKQVSAAIFCAAPQDYVYKDPSIVAALDTTQKARVIEVPNDVMTSLHAGCKGFVTPEATFPCATASAIKANQDGYNGGAVQEGGNGSTMTIVEFPGELRKEPSTYVTAEHLQCSFDNGLPLNFLACNSAVTKRCGPGFAGGILLGGTPSQATYVCIDGSVGTPYGLSNAQMAAYQPLATFPYDPNKYGIYVSAFVRACAAIGKNGGVPLNIDANNTAGICFN